MGHCSDISTLKSMSLKSTQRYGQRKRGKGVSNIGFFRACLTADAIIYGRMITIHYEKISKSGCFTKRHHKLPNHNIQSLISYTLTRSISQPNAYMVDSFLGICGCSPCDIPDCVVLATPSNTGEKE